MRYIEDIAFPVIILTGLIGFGLLINAGINEDIRERECKIELATQTKLDTSNIIHLCKQGK